MTRSTLLIPLRHLLLLQLEELLKREPFFVKIEQFEDIITTFSQLNLPSQQFSQTHHHCIRAIMLFRSAALGLQLAFLHSVGAQTSTKRIAFYSMEGCDANRGDPELLVNQFYATGENAESDEDLSCRVSSWANDDWPRDRKSDRYETWVDQSSIGSGCKLLVYQVSEGFDGADRNCITEYRRLDDNNDCTKLLLPKKFGYR